jgi:hypothetical protein
LLGDDLAQRELSRWPSWRREGPDQHLLWGPTWDQTKPEVSHSQLGFDVSIVNINKHPGPCVHERVRPHKWRVVRLNIIISKGFPYWPHVLSFVRWNCPSQSKYRNLVWDVYMTWK